MHCIPLWHVLIDFDASLTGERPTAQDLQSLIWKDGVTTKEVRIMDEVKSRWREFGVALGFSIGDLDAIEEEGLRKPGRCIQSLLGEWSRKKTETYHWNGLISALFSAGIPDLATRVTRALPHKVAR